MSSILLITCIPIKSHLVFPEYIACNVAAAGGMAGECLSLPAPACVMCGNFAPMRALLSALRRRGGGCSAAPTNRTQERKVQQHLRKITLCRPWKRDLCAAVRSVSNHRSGSQGWRAARGSRGRLANVRLLRIGPFGALGNNNGLRLHRQLTAGDARGSRTGLERLEPGQQRRVDPSDQCRGSVCLP